jgi:hypothetical protein
VIIGCAVHTGIRFAPDFAVLGPNSPGATVHRGFALTDVSDPSSWRRSTNGSKATAPGR